MSNGARWLQGAVHSERLWKWVANSLSYWTDSWMTAEREREGGTAAKSLTGEGLPDCDWVRRMRLEHRQVDICLTEHSLSSIFIFKHKLENSLCSPNCIRNSLSWTASEGCSENLSRYFILKALRDHLDRAFKISSNVYNKYLCLLREIKGNTEDIWSFYVHNIDIKVRGRDAGGHVVQRWFQRQHSGWPKCIWANLNCACLFHPNICGVQRKILEETHVHKSKPVGALVPFSPSALLTVSVRPQPFIHISLNSLVCFCDLWCISAGDLFLCSKETMNYESFLHPSSEQTMLDRNYIRSNGVYMDSELHIILSSKFDLRWVISDYVWQSEDMTRMKKRNSCEVVQSIGGVDSSRAIISSGSCNLGNRSIFYLPEFISCHSLRGYFCPAGGAVILHRMNVICALLYSLFTCISLHLCPGRIL